jgi:hypothetical protein
MKEFLLKFGRDRRRWVQWLFEAKKRHGLQPFGGYNELQTPRARYAVLDYERLQDVLNFRSMDEIATAHRTWVEEAMLSGNRRREGKWTESIAVGNETFVKTTKEKLGGKALGREVIEAGDSYALKEASAPYQASLPQENCEIRPENGY